jgi:membrane-bound serine protease (ClpP class)
VSALPILLVFASLAVFVLEVLVVSFGALAVVGIALGVGGIVLAFGESAAYGWTMAGILVVGIPLVLRGAFKVLPKLKFARGLYLDAPALSAEQRRAAAEPARDLMGAVGVATSPLRPSGSADFEGRPVAVVAAGTMIDRGTRVRVVEVTGNRVVVEPADAAT